MSLEQFFCETVLKITTFLFHLSPTSSHLHPLRVENCDSNSRLVVDEDDNGKFRLDLILTITIYYYFNINYYYFCTIYINLYYRMLCCNVIQL